MWPKRSNLNVSHCVLGLFELYTSGRISRDACKQGLCVMWPCEESHIKLVTAHIFMKLQTGTKWARIDRDDRWKGQDRLRADRNSVPDSHYRIPALSLPASQVMVVPVERRVMPPTPSTPAETLLCPDRAACVQVEEQGDASGPHWDCC